MGTGDRNAAPSEAQVNVRSLNPPTIPVRLNRRTQLKPLSRLNGDWLPQLKKIKTSEMSGQVRGHNASEELHTRRLVEQWFVDTSWQLGKLNKAQGAALTDLARLHLERRELRRNMYKWRQEEARQQEEKDRQHEIRKAEMDRLSLEIERSTKAMRRESRKMSRRLTESLFSQFSPTRKRSTRLSISSIDSGSSAPDGHFGQGIEPDPLAEALILPPFSENLAPTLEEEEPADAHPEVVQRDEMVKSRVLEVRRGGQAPLVRTRTKSDLGEEEKSKEEEEEAQVKSKTSKKGKKSPKKKSEQTENKRSVSVDAVDYVSISNSPSPSPRGHARIGRRINIVSSGRAFSTIIEDPDAVYEDRSHSVAVAEIGHAPSSDSSTPPSSSCHSDRVAVPKISVMEENKRRFRQRLRMQEKILQEPFVSYRKDKVTGHLRAMERPPPPPNFAEPSNKNEYRRVCLLRNEKIAFEEKVNSLEDYTAQLLQEEAKQRSDQLAARARQEEEDRLLAERVPEIRALGPSDWMRAFVHSGAPVGEDPNDPDNIKFCRYIRKDGERVVDLAPGERRRKISSWDPV